MIEVLKQMVEALETYGDKHRKTYLLEGAWDEEITKGDAAIQAGKQAIAELESQEPEAAPVAKNEGGKITWMIDDWPQNCLLYTHPPKSFTYEQVKAHIRAASMSANDIVVGSDVTNDGVSIVIRRRDEILYAEFFTHPPQRTEQNFCSRCGKRTKDSTHIHTCTPPQD